MGAFRLKAKKDSHFIANHVFGKYQEKEPQLIKYLQKVWTLSSCFTSFEIEHVPHERKFIAELLSKLATSKIVDFNRTVIQETLVSSTIDVDEVNSLEVVLESSWMSPILCYLHLDEILLDEGEARKIWKQVVKYTLLSRKLYKMKMVSAMLGCIGKHETTMVIAKVHKGVCNSHISGKPPPTRC